MAGIVAGEHEMAMKLASRDCVPVTASGPLRLPQAANRPTREKAPQTRGFSASRLLGFSPSADLHAMDDLDVAADVAAGVSARYGRCIRYETAPMAAE
jgi:hypothetical protein